MNEPLPQSESDDDNAENTDNIVFFPVSEGKLITLYLLSFGFYGMYWFYKNWQILAPEMGKKIYPFWRAVFSIFFVHSLFKRIEHKASHLEHRHRYNSLALSVIFILCTLLSQLLDPSSVPSDGWQNAGQYLVAVSLLLFAASAYPLVKVQSTVNRLNNDILGYLNNRYTGWNYLLISVGGFLWAIIILGYVAQSMGFAPAQ
jgi:hypothetical protein